MLTANDLFLNFFNLYYCENENCEIILEALIKLFDRVGSKMDSLEKSDFTPIKLQDIHDNIESIGK